MASSRAGDVAAGEVGGRLAMVTGAEYPPLPGAMSPMRQDGLHGAGEHHGGAAVESKSRRSPGGFWCCWCRWSVGADQCAQLLAVPASSAVRKLEPQPQAVTAFGLLTVNPAPMSVST